MRTYLRQRRQLLWWLTALALFFAAYFALRTDRTAMNRLCGSVIFPAMRQVARLCDGFDGSVGEVLILTAIWAGIIWLACTVRRLIAGPRRRAVLADFVLTAACLMLTVYGGFCLLWGTAYSTDSFQDRSGIVAQPVSVEELEQVTRYFASELTAAADGVPRDASGVCAADRKTILAAAGDAYDGVYDEFPFLRVETGGVKPFACSNALSVLRFTGFYFPFTGEANVNMDSPVAWLPSTVCHEMAHQRGVISEQECNFIGILAATRCADPVYRYSGWLEGYVYLSNALYRADPDRSRAIRETLPETVLADPAGGQHLLGGVPGAGVPSVGECVRRVPQDQRRRQRHPQLRHGDGSAGDVLRRCQSIKKQPRSTASGLLFYAFYRPRPGMFRPPVRAFMEELMASSA